MIRVLVIDDEAHILRILQLSLQRAGYKVTVASDGQKGLELLRQQHPDIVIADIDMPNMNGKDMCLSFYQEFPDNSIPIFISTSRAEDEFRSWTQPFKNIHFLEKPLSINILLRRLAEILDQTAGPRPIEQGVNLG